MKIYNKLEFWFTIVITVTAPLVWWLTDWFSWQLLILYIWMIFNGLHWSLSKEATEKAKRAEEQDRRIRRKHFGPFAGIVPFVWVILLLAAWILSMIVPNEGLNPPTWLRWVLGILLVLSVGHMFWYSWIMDKYRDLDDAET